MLCCNLATASITKFLLSSLFCLPPTDCGSVECCRKMKCYRSTFHCAAYHLQPFSHLWFFSPTYGLFVYSYTVHHTRDTTAREFLSRSFVAWWKTNYATHFRPTLHCQGQLHVYWLATRFLLNHLTCNFYSVCSISKIKYPYTFASFRSLVLEYGGREPYFWDVPHIRSTEEILE